jgi:hypothetical protein
LYDQTFVQSSVKIGQMFKDKGWKCLLPLKLPVLNYMLLFTEDGRMDGSRIPKIAFDCSRKDGRVMGCQERDWHCEGGTGQRAHP